jgi:serine/threonine-protein kinase HipA
MPRRRAHAPLRVLLNNRLVGQLSKDAGGAVSFRYDASWLGWENALPVSLSLPLREDAWRGAPVVAVFDNLLPDVDALRRRVAERVGADGIDVFSLLSMIGRDCVGALQFVPDDVDALSAVGPIEGEPIDDAAIAHLLGNLAQAPLGLSRDDPFRISVAGAQEKTALLRHDGRWLKPLGTTPTTHILKPRIGRLSNGIDLTLSAENEFYCMNLAAAFGLPVANVEMADFGGTTALVIERFDRLWARDGRLLRLPQEDCCQALSVPPSRKYQADGGPKLVDVLDLLKGSDTPTEDRLNVFKAQIFFWLIGATDGHAKNFSIFLSPGGGYRLTPLYDILTAEPSLAAREIEPKQMKLALSVGTRNHYRIGDIHGRHFVQTGEAAGLSSALIGQAFDEMRAAAERAFTTVEAEMPSGFPEAIHATVKRAAMKRLTRLGKPAMNSARLMRR